MMGDFCSAVVCPSLNYGPTSLGLQVLLSSRAPSLHHFSMGPVEVAGVPQLTDEHYFWFRSISKRFDKPFSDTQG